MTPRERLEDLITSIDLCREHDHLSPLPRKINCLNCLEAALCDAERDVVRKERIRMIEIIRRAEWLPEEASRVLEGIINQGTLEQGSELREDPRSNTVNNEEFGEVTSFYPGAQIIL